MKGSFFGLQYPQFTFLRRYPCSDTAISILFCTQHFLHHILYNIRHRIVNVDSSWYELLQNWTLQSLKLEHDQTQNVQNWQHFAKLDSFQIQHRMETLNHYAMGIMMVIKIKMTMEMIMTIRRWIQISGHQPMDHDLLHWLQILMVVSWIKCRDEKRIERNLN